MIFDSGNWARWTAVVTVFDANDEPVDLSPRLTGQISVSAAEDSSRVATFSFIPSSSAVLAWILNRWITIDVVLTRDNISETTRIFSGITKTKTLSASGRVLTLSCCDQWKTCVNVLFNTESQVIGAFPAGKVFPSAALLPWRDDAEPGQYFAGILETALGATAMTADGTWNFVSWDIGTPVATFDESGVDEDSVEVNEINNSDIPPEVIAELRVRAHRLHSVDVDVTWERVDRSRYVVDGLPTLPKSTAQAALDGLSEWYVKGEATLTQPVSGNYPVIVGGQTVYYLVDYQQAQMTCDALSATLYRRWYQELEIVYTMTFDLGGESSQVRVSNSIASDFDASAWESARRTEPSTGVFYANAPGGGTPPTGYEALPEPRPPTNSAINYFGNLTAQDIDSAFSHVTAKALRQTAQIKRRRTLRFSRPIDPRFEIGSVIGVSAYGVTATGQVVELEYTLDLDTGDAGSRFTLAVPEGNGMSMGFTADIVQPAASVTHAFPDVLAGNHVGASLDTPVNPDESTLVGFLCNVLPTSNNYDAVKPVYVTQFRLIMPPIPSFHRDPVVEPVAVTGSYTISSGSLSISF